MNYARDALRPHTVYRFFDAGGALLYVGCSSDWYSRWKCHGATKEWWTQITTITLARYPEMALAVAAEAEAIRTEKPRYGTQHQQRHCQKCQTEMAHPRNNHWVCRECKRAYARARYAQKLAAAGKTRTYETK